MKQLHQREKQDLARILTQNGHKNAQDMVAVLDAFLSSESHQGVEELHRRLKTRGLNFSREFVREALDLFCRLGFAQAKSFEGQEVHYEHRHLGQHHDHMICTRCGRVEEFINSQIEELQFCAASEKGFVPLDHQMVIYGLCRECALQPGQEMTLGQAQRGERLVVCGYSGGSESARRLTDMGLNPGVEIEVLGSNGHGPVVVACRGSRLALGRGFSDKVKVKPAGQN
ncbi:MAG: transcriptional repressor [Thermodesulfobacteriota bacterium]